ncbi:phosphonate C-P lyase system protein PhnH [Martelella alba]|uniref:Phosphonate C-P lyase system protein PhnH n=1 Tax=Martelella alba TaxID=2590451 RepID=A0ABY2SPF9_9HYPH|nr:phosphonate C-P lyase system protein PhnH [Martelella alba]TKI07760.1 phosphonate C-P lyase system protein PhnH [Martelella alba]
MALLNGFSRPVDAAQHSFRRILKALSEPGYVVALPDGPRWESIGPAASALLLTLADGETAVYIAPALSRDSVAASVRFHTGAPLAEQPQQAVLALFDGQMDDAILATLPCGDALSPENGVTVLVQIDSLAEGTPLRLRGPGIRDERIIAPALPPAVLRYLLRRPHPFPAGLDFILLCEDRLMAVPRTIHVEVC